MPPLTVINHRTQVEDRLIDTLRLAFKERRVAADVAALAALDVALEGALLFEDGALCYVTAENCVFVLSLYSGAAASADVVVPATLPSNYARARWLRSSNPLNFGPNYNAPLRRRAAGYCKAVEIFNGQGSTDEAMEQVLAQRPAMWLQWTGDQPRPQSAGYPGAYYKNTLDFQIMVVSECNREGPWTMWGSPYSAEASDDPGIDRMIGEIRKVLAGSRLGLDGVERTEIGAARILSEDNGRRLFIATVDIEVRVYFYIPDEDLVANRIDVQPELVDTGAEQFDPMNYIAEGYQVTAGPGLSFTYPSGIAMIEGAAVTSTPDPKTFTAEMDTYRDLNPDGTFTYQEVPVGYAAPPLTEGAMRVGVTTTDATDIVQDKILCSSAFVFHAAYQVVP